MRKVALKTGGVAAVIVVLCTLIASFQGLGGFGFGGRGGASPGGGAAGVSTNASKSNQVQPADPMLDRVLTIRVDGGQILIGDREVSADEAAQEAVDRQALSVRILRSETATARARETLAASLKARQIAYHVSNP